MATNPIIPALSIQTALGIGTAAREALPNPGPDTVAIEKYLPRSSLFLRSNISALSPSPLMIYTDLSFSLKGFPMREGNPKKRSNPRPPVDVRMLADQHGCLRPLLMLEGQVAQEGFAAEVEVPPRDLEVVHAAFGVGIHYKLDLAFT
jgi:hypothetical protein